MYDTLSQLAIDGWKTFDFTLMRDDDGSPILVSDLIIREYMGYIRTCRAANRAELSFGDWMTESDPRAFDIDIRR